MIPLTAQPRSAVKAKVIRRSQFVPGIVYGHGYAPRSLQFEYLTLSRALQRAGTSHVVALDIAGEPQAQTVLLREVQRDPITSRIMHVDFYAIRADEKVRIHVPIVQRGKSPAEQLGGTVVQTLGSVELECLPRDIPEIIEIDVSRLEVLHSHFTVADLPIPPNVVVLSPRDMGVVHVAVQRAKVEEVEEAPVAAAEGAAEAAPAPAEEPKAETKGQTTSGR